MPSKTRTDRRHERSELLQSPLAAVAIDLTRIHRRTVTSFYSNLVTRPTGRAVRSAVESQLLESAGAGPCLSILDFTQVRVMDYSCADEIVAKLLLRYAAEDRPVNAYFLARGLQAHHVEAVHAVLERHGLLLAVTGQGDQGRLLGPCTTLDRNCWALLLDRGLARAEEIAGVCGFPVDDVATSLHRFVRSRVAVPIAEETICALPNLRGEG